MPQNFLAKAGKKTVTLTWSAGSPPPSGGYRVYYDQAGKLQFHGAVSASTLSYKDAGLTSRVSYTYVVTSWTDCNTNGVYDPGVDTESPPSNRVTATAQ